MCNHFICIILPTVHARFIVFTTPHCRQSVRGNSNDSIKPRDFMYIHNIMTSIRYYVELPVTNINNELLQSAHKDLSTCIYRSSVNCNLNKLMCIADLITFL